MKKSKKIELTELTEPLKKGDWFKSVILTDEDFKNSIITPEDLARGIITDREWEEIFKKSSIPIIYG